MIEGNTLLVVSNNTKKLGFNGAKWKFRRTELCIKHLYFMCEERKITFKRNFSNTLSTSGITKFMESPNLQLCNSEVCVSVSWSGVVHFMRMLSSLAVL